MVRTMTHTPSRRAWESTRSTAPPLRAALRFIVAACLATLTGGILGCHGIDWTWPQSVDEANLRAQTIAYLKQAIAYPHSGLVRCQAIEALAQDAARGAEGWFIEALSDESAAVRFAGCVALGRLRYLPAKPMVERRLGDEDHSVRAAAIFALHRMGDYTHSGELAEMLLYHKNKEVRGNVAMLFGLLGEPKAVKLLQRCQKDDAYMVVWQALESRLLLGDPQALPRVAAQVNSGRADLSVLAMLALGRAGNQRSVDVLRYRLNQKDDHIESRLAAARGLGMLGHADGLDLARGALTWNDPTPDARSGSPEDQIMRVRSMAALALGAIRSRTVLPQLRKLMTESQDPRIQVAAAWATLQIVSKEQRQDSPLRPPLGPEPLESGVP